MQSIVKELFKQL